MKKIFKLAAGVFAATLAVSSFAGCSKKDETVQSTDQKNFTYWAVVDANTQSTGIGSYSDLMLYQELEKRTGVHLDFIHPVQGSTGSEAFVTMLTAGKRPDMIEYNWGVTQKFRFESFCYGPKNCKLYKMGKPRAVPYKDCGSSYDEGWLDEICTENRDWDE